MTDPSTGEFTAAERAALQNLPAPELVDLAVELDLLVPAQIDRMGLFADIVVALAQRARAEGLPISPYDRDELLALSDEELRAVAALCGAPPSVDDLLKMGAKVSKRYRADRPRSQVALMVPTLLAPLARFVARRGA